LTPDTYYRRHRQNCKGRHPHNDRSTEYDERKKGWARCECPIFASGTLQGAFRRQNTGEWEWPKAQAIGAHWEAAARWDGTPIVPPSPAPLAEPSRTTLERATKAFIAEVEETAAINTQRKYRLQLRKLTKFAESRGFVMVDQWTPIDIREFRASWGVSPQTATKNMSSIKTFFEFCVSSEWLNRNPARTVKRQRTRDAADRRNEQKLPFSEEELKRMYDACEHKYVRQPITWHRTNHGQPAEGTLNRYNRKWTGQDLSDFISVSVYTGLRISDVAMFHINRMQPTGEIHLRTTKSGAHVYAWVPGWLQERIRERARTVGPYIFGQHQTADINVVTDVWRRKGSVASMKATAKRGVSLMRRSHLVRPRMSSTNIAWPEMSSFLSISPAPYESRSSLRSLEAFATPRGRTGSPDMLGDVASRLCDLVRRCCSSSVLVDTDSVDRVPPSVSVPR